MGSAPPQSDFLGRSVPLVELVIRNVHAANEIFDADRIEDVIEPLLRLFQGRRNFLDIIHQRLGGDDVYGDEPIAGISDVIAQSLLRDTYEGALDRPPAGRTVAASAPGARTTCFDLVRETKRQNIY